VKEQAPAIALSDVCVMYGPDTVLESATLVIRRGEFVGIVGPNGGGKSTMLRASLGLVPTSRGKVQLFGTDLARFDGWRRIGYVPQFASHVDVQFPATVLEVATLGLVAQRGLLRWMRAADREKALHALEEVGASHLAGRHIGTLSGGERQRVFLAKALAGEPELLILDEPTTGVDPKARGDFHELLDHLNHEHDLTVVLVSHDTEAIATSAHRLVAVNRRIVFDGSPKDFREQERVASVYGMTITHGEGAPRHQGAA